MKKLYLIIAFLLHSFCHQAYSQIVNDGALIFIGNDNLLYTDQSYVHNFGTLFNYGEMIVKGNWINNNFNSKVLDQSSTGINKFAGTLQQIGGSGTTQFAQLVFVGNGVATLGRNIEARLLLDLSAKEVITGGNSLTLTNVDVNSLKRTSGFINTNNGGIFIRKTNSSLPYLFPLGSEAATIFRPVTVTPKDNQTNTFGITLLNKDANDDGYNRLSKRADVTEINSKYYYKVSQTSGMSNVDFTFFTATRDGDYNAVTSWIDNRIWEKQGLVNMQDGSFFGGSLNRSITYSLVNNNIVSLPAPLINVPFNLAKVADVNNPLVFFNAFSPDGDGKNDRWEIKNINNFPENDLKIYDRSGNIIFKRTGYHNTVAWDGENAKPGTYFYILKVKINGEDKYYKGAITLIKN